MVRDVLSSRPDVTVLDAPAILATALGGGASPGPAGPGTSGPAGPGTSDAGIPGLRSPDPDGRYAQFWPHRHGTDAIFLALLRSTPAAPQGPRT